MTDLEIFNWALIKLGQLPLKKTEAAQHPHGVLCEALLKPLHRSTLRTFVWNFATRRDVLAPLAGDQGTGTIYTLPKKCIRVLQIDQEGELNGDHILVSSSSSENLNIKYIEAVALSECEPLYLEAVACKLASELCLTLLADTQFSLRLKAEYEGLMKKALEIDNAEEKIRY